MLTKAATVRFRLDKDDKVENLANSMYLKWSTANWLPNQISPELLLGTSRYHPKTLEI